MTFSLAAVFIPFLFMGGIIGKLFHEFAVTIGVAILVSGFVSLTLTPMLSQPVPAQPSTIARTAGSTTPPSGSSTGGWTSTSGRWPGSCSAGRAALVFSARDAGRDRVALLGHSQGPLPDRRHRASCSPPPRPPKGISFDALMQRQQQVAAVVAEDPDVRSVTSSVGTTPAANQGQLTIDLKPIGERQRSAEQIIARI